MGNNDPRHDLVKRKGRGLHGASGPSRDPNDPRHSRAANVFLDERFVGFGLKIDNEGKLSVDLEEVAEYEAERVDILSVPFHMDADVTLVDTAQPNSEQLFNNGARHIVIAPLGTYRQARLVVNMRGTAAPAGGTMDLEYSVPYLSSRTGFLQIGRDGPVQVATDVADIVADSGWIEMTMLARDDVHLAIITAGGGATNPEFGNILAYFRR